MQLNHWLGRFPFNSQIVTCTTNQLCMSMSLRVANRGTPPKLPNKPRGKSRSKARRNQAKAKTSKEIMHAVVEKGKEDVKLKVVDKGKGVVVCIEEHSILLNESPSSAVQVAPHLVSQPNRDHLYFASLLFLILVEIIT